MFPVNTEIQGMLGDEPSSYNISSNNPYFGIANLPYVDMQNLTEQEFDRALKVEKLGGDQLEFLEKTINTLQEASMYDNRFLNSFKFFNYEEMLETGDVAGGIKKGLEAFEESLSEDLKYEVPEYKDYFARLEDKNARTDS